MNIYSIALFLHIVGAMGFSAVLALEWLGLRQMRNAITPEQVRAWMGTLKGTRKASFAFMLTTVITGFYMMATVWGGVPWISVTLGSLILVIALSLVLSGPRMVAIGRALASEKGQLSRAFHSLTAHPLLWVSIQTRVAITLGIVFLKIAKPDLVGSLLTIGVAIALGVISVVSISRPEPVREGSVH